ncbi:MAG: hypothetical protein HQ566_00390 [Candidatus Omnitrophica bacterium]|nr:hypothetical protein [Candidatus Omnitrophota bacterium]
MYKLFIFFYVLLLAILGVGATLMAEEITLTTYYPAPYGNYEELQATKLAVGSATTMPTTDGDLNVSDTINATAYSVGGTAGHTNTYTVVTSVDFVNQAVTTEEITVTNGIVIP